MRKFFKKATTPLITIAMALSLGTFINKADNGIVAKAASYSWLADSLGGEPYNLSNGNLTMPATFSMNSDWDITFVEGASNANPVAYYSPDIRMYSVRASGDGNEFLIKPSSTNTTQAMTQITITEGNNSATQMVTVWAGNTEDGLIQLPAPTFTNKVYTYTDLSGFKYFKLKNSYTTSTGTKNLQFHFMQIDLEYSAAGAPDEITTFAVTPTSKTYWTTDTLEAADFTLNYTKNGSATTGDGSSVDYTARIGTGTGDSFTGTDIVWGTTKPTEADTTIQFKSTSDNGAGVYLTADVALTVTAPTVNSIAISGAMTTKSYFTVGEWDPTGLIVTATLSNGVNEDVTADVEWSFDPAAPNSTAITSVVVTATYEGKTASSTQTGIVVSEKVMTLVISEYYGGGGNSSAPLNKDFVEIYNATDENIDLEGYHIHYFSATGTSSGSNVVALSGTILANSYFLAQQDGGTNGVDLPTPDHVGPLKMGASNFKVALTNSEASPEGPTDTSVVDYVGGGTANAYEGAGAAPAASNTKSVSRLLDENNVPIDTDNNAADFVQTDPTPQNTALSIADYVMAEDVANQCIARYPIAKAKMLATSNGQRAFFESGADHETANGHSLVDARARYEAWARYHNDAQPYGGELSPMPYVKLTNTTLNTIVASVVIVGLSVIAVYYFYIRKKKHN